MAFGSCFSCIKYTVFLFNGLLWLLGCTLLAVGTWLRMDNDAGRYVEQLTTTTTPEGDKPPLTIRYSDVSNSDLASKLALLFIVVGSVVFVIAVVGCCGAVRNSQCLLGAFFMALFLVLATLLGIGIWSFIARNNVDVHTVRLQRLTNRMLRSAVPNFYLDPGSRRFMDSLQKRLRCCGADNAEGDYVRRGSNKQPPCAIPYRRQSCLPAYFNYVATHFENFMRNRLVIMASIAIATAAFSALGMLCVLMLYCAVKESNWSSSNDGLDSVRAVFLSKVDRKRNRQSS